LFRWARGVFFCLVLGFRLFLFERREGIVFVGLVVLIMFLFRVGLLAQFFVGVGFSRSPVGFRSFCGRGGDRDKFC
jgi:hypothetical protein